METNSERAMLSNQYHSLLEILHRKNLSYEVPTDEEIKAMNNADLGAWVKSLEKIARTPTD